MDGAHDMGGMHGFGSVVPDGDVFHAEWERRLFALTRVARQAGITAGHSRAMIESMPAVEYLDASYYERWLWGFERRLVRAGTVTEDDIASAMARIAGEELPVASDPELAERAVAAQRAGGPMPAAAGPAFRPGQRVRVRRMRPEGHTRCPRYVRGAIGVIERVHGDDLLADADAAGERDPVEAVYAVRFRSDDLFGPRDEPPYRVLVDLWESYLEEESS
ncbi:MAG: nitrile hydratase subunit beta [Gaiellales bacterium]|nr:nitrile hydratase subunit beta [Gaiellales bacterium]